MGMLRNVVLVVHAFVQKARYAHSSRRRSVQRGSRMDLKLTGKRVLVPSFLP